MSSAEVESWRLRLRELPALAALSGPEWEAALGAATLARASNGAAILRCCRAGDHFSIVLEGMMRVRTISPQGRALNVYRVTPGGMCVLSLATAYLQQRPSLELRAEGDVVLLQIPRSHLPRLFATCNAFSRYFMHAMETHVATLMGTVEALSFGCLRSRTLAVLVDRSLARGSRPLKITHQELAEDLGCSREAISRLLKELEHDGRLRLGRGVIELLDTGPNAAHMP